MGYKQALSVILQTPKLYNWALNTIVGGLRYNVPPTVAPHLLKSKDPIAEYSGLITTQTQHVGFVYT